MKKIVSRLIRGIVTLGLVLSAVFLVVVMWGVIGIALMSPLLLIGTSLLGLQSFIIMNFLSSIVLATGSFYLLGHFIRITRAFQQTIQSFLKCLFTVAT